MGRRKSTVPRPVLEASRVVVMRLRRESYRTRERGEGMLVADAVERLREALQPLTLAERRRAIVAIAAVFGDLDLVQAITTRSLQSGTPKAVTL